MRILLHNGLVVFTFIASVLIPQKALSNPLFDEGSWRAHSFYTRISWAAPSSGIGGLEANINNARTLVLKPSAIFYSNGYLYANIESKQLSVEVSPEIVQEVIRVVEHTDDLVFQVSVDITALGENRYIDERLQNTKIGKLLLKGDLGFASIVQSGQPYPKQAPIHPYIEALRLLNSNVEYRQLPHQWEMPSLSWPQIYLHFNPTVPGLVSMEFKPQVLFRSASGLSLEVDNKVEALGELPYLPLIKDVKERPLAYREISSELDTAASITATLGLLKAACNKPGSCRDIENQTKINSGLSEARTSKQKVAQDFLTGMYKSQFQSRWAELSFPVFKPSNTPEAWAAAYDTLQRALFLEKKSAWLKKDATQLKETAAKQFLHYPVPNDPLLQAASAVVLAWNKQGIAAKQNLNIAIQGSNNHPGDRIEVARMGLSVAQHIRDYKDIQLGNEIHDSSITLWNEAQMRAYDEVDKYLQSCLENFKTCSDKDLRRWEAEAFRARLDNRMSTRDLAWLHGRFAYLIGIQLKDPVKQRDRLRFLSFYAQKAQGNHTSKLHKLEADFQNRLGITPNSSSNPNLYLWITVITIGVLSASSYIIWQKKKILNINKKRDQLNKIFKL